MSARDPRRCLVVLLPLFPTGFVLCADLLAISLQFAFPPVYFDGVCLMRAIVVTLDGAIAMIVQKNYPMLNKSTTLMTSGILPEPHRIDGDSVDCKIFYSPFLNELDKQITMIRSSLNEIE